MKALAKHGRARFWLYWNRSFVRLTLKPGETMSFHTGGYHDEGWWRDAETFEYRDGIVYRSVARDSTDCDGRHGSYRDLECPVDKLKAVKPCGWLGNIYQGWELKQKVAGQEGVMLPDWEEESAREYDQFAEMMNY